MTISRKLLSALVLLALVSALVGALALWWTRTPVFHEGCLSIESRYAICAASDMARYSRKEPITLEHEDFDISDRVIKLVAARNESIAFQLVVRTLTSDAPVSVGVKSEEWINKANNIKVDVNTELFVAHYHWVDDAGYQWGPDSEVLDWPAHYPDALVPQQKQCNGQVQTIFDTVKLAEHTQPNQALWFDTFIPASMPAGQYVLNIMLQIETQTIDIVVQLDVVDAILPDKPSITALGELYRAYRVEGVGESRDTEQWRSMSYCYQQLAHQHRMVFIERTPTLPEGQAWSNYIETVDPVLSGKLFTEAFNYNGTGVNTPPVIWRTPWPQEYDVKLERPLTEADLQRYTTHASHWAKAVEENGWADTHFFAYVFDEIDGPSYDKVKDHAYLAMAHLQMGFLQLALDEGSPKHPIDLLWTSHANPAKWVDDPELDLRNKIRLWSPNASAADPDFLGQQIETGDNAWFYHSGHPAVGTHSINSSGIEMRTWGLIAARYGFQGQFMWAVNLGSDEQPFAEPSYKPDDDRFGNGVLVYPGNQLDKIGYQKSPGPIPSMRLKSWRRGLQDAELYYLAKNKHPQKAEALLRAHIPYALAEAKGKAAWPSDPALWIEFRKKLLLLASE